MNYIHSKNPAAALVFLFLLLSNIIFCFIPQNVFADSGWYSTNWSYQKTITINGTVAGAQSNYQIPFVLEYGSGTDSIITIAGRNGLRIYLNNKSQPDFDDAIFTNSVNTKLDHCIESYITSVNATVWVEVDSIPIAPNQITINLYYGNAAATSSSNITATFIFGDDFNRTDSATVGNSWTETETGGTWAIVSNKLVGTYTGAGAFSITHTTAITTTKSKWETYVTANTTNCQANILWDANTASKELGYLYSSTSVINYLDSSAPWTTTGITSTANAYDRLQAIHNSNNSTGEYYVNNTRIIGEVTGLASGVTNRISYGNLSAATKLTVDWIFIRNYCDPEPAVSGIGVETGLGNLPQIQDIKIFEGFKSTGDWLIVIRYLNRFTPYYDTYDVKQYFALQLLDIGGTIRASSACPAWGNKVGCIYLAPDQVTALNWGSAYTVRIYGTFTGNPYTSYTLQSTDWVGVDLTKLDSWVITSSGVIGTYYSTLLTTNISTRGEVLNSDGANIFNNGIPGLMLKRPDLFQISKSNPAGSTTTFTQTNRKSNYADIVGTDTANILLAIGDLINVDGRTMGAIICVGLMVILGAFALKPGHTMAANILVVPIIIMGAGLLLIDQALIAIIFLVVSVLVFWQLVANKGG